MKRSFGSLIIMPPSSPRVHQFRVSTMAIVLILSAGLLTFLAVVSVPYLLPPPPPDVERIRLERENQSLRTHNRNLEVQAERLNYRVMQLEEMSQKITHLMEAD